jgi:pantothenate synthetase
VGDAETFLPVTQMHVRCEILIAARIGGTRLIDVLTPGTDERLAVGVGG